MMLSSTDEEDVPPVNNVKRQLTVNKKTFDILQIMCEWNGCNEVLPKSKSTFYNHVSSHLKDPQIVFTDELDEEKYKCNWSSCNFEVLDPKEITRHLKYHAYHAELRALGQHVSKVLKLPSCMILSEFNVLNNVDDSPLICNWNFCSEVSKGIMEFIDHVHYHVKLLPSHNVSFKCLWTDCNSDFQVKSKLTDHVKTHTKQHFIACSQCGHTFANKTKFVDHCLTQKPFEEHTYQCDYCLSFHPSERILRKHMGQHIHHYKCPFCNMTCNKPSLLAKHIRYRHLNYRAFKCSLCDVKCKSKQDLQLHVMTHVKGFHVCQEEGCSYVTPSQLTMKMHMETLHVPGRERGLFCCHICDKKYSVGAKLTKHLSAKHNLKRPPGYSRFIYRLESDGNRRLQSVRLESLEVQEVTEPEPPAEVVGGVECVLEGQEDAAHVIAVEVLGETGQIVSSSVVIPEDSLPPPDAEILAVGE